MWCYRHRIELRKQKENTMRNQNNLVTVSYVKEQYTTFFNRVRVLYNISFSKDEKGREIEDVKRFANELYEAGRIDDYTKRIIDESIETYTSQLNGQIRNRAVDLEYLDATISLAIDDINAEIGGLIQ